MRIDLGLILAIIIEYILFIYYADTLFYRKRNKYLCYGIIAVGYLIHFATCTMGNVAVNVSTGIAINAICLLLCYHVSVKTAVFQSTLLMTLVFADEFVVVALPNMNMVYSATQISPEQSFVITIVSRILYLIEITCISRVLYKKQKHYNKVSLFLVIIPIISVAIIWLLIPVEAEKLTLVATLIACINVFVFAIDQKIFRKELEATTLKDQLEKEKIAYEEYTILSEKYEQTRIFRHDLKEHLSVLNTLIDQNPENAKVYIKSIYDKEENMQFERFSNNKILNILLSKKKDECVKQEIEFLLEPIQADLGFISDMDTVTLFSNLINNGIESSVNSVEKKIFLTINTSNENFIIIKIENSCDIKPIVINAKLKTMKDNEKLHGIGMNSIKRVIKNYNGSLSWKYDEDNKIFITAVILQRMTARAEK